SRVTTSSLDMQHVLGHGRPARRRAGRGRTSTVGPYWAPGGARSVPSMVGAASAEDNVRLAFHQGPIGNTTPQRSFRPARRQPRSVGLRSSNSPGDSASRRVGDKETGRPEDQQTWGPGAWELISALSLTKPKPRRYPDYARGGFMRSHVGLALLLASCDT